MLCVAPVWVLTEDFVPCVQTHTLLQLLNPPREPEGRPLAEFGCVIKTSLFTDNIQNLESMNGVSPLTGSSAMNKLRQSLRRKKDIYVPESSRPHQWQTDEEAVRSGKCSFAVKVTPTQTRKHTFAPNVHRIIPIDRVRVRLDRSSSVSMREVITAAF